MHKAKRHGITALQRAAWGTACEVCRRQYWSTRRLREHFRRSPGCALAYQQAEVGDVSVLEPVAPDCVPPTTLIGPCPWWATLRPLVQHAPAHPTPGNRVAVPDIQDLREIHQVPTFLVHWLRLVEKGVAWHAYVGDKDWLRPIVRLAGQIFEHFHLDGDEHVATAGDVAAIWQGSRLLLGPAALLREAREALWPFL